MTTATISKETVAPARKLRRPDLHVVPTNDIESMAQRITAEASHLRPAITQESIDRQELSGRLADRHARRDELLEKKRLVHDFVATFDDAIDDEVADLDQAIALYSGINACA